MSTDHLFPVLMYHKVSDNNFADFLTIKQSDLETQFRYIVQEKYTTISVAELINYHYYRQPLPEKPILLTFDDGYADNYNHLFPLLKKYSFKAVIFIVSSFIGKQNESEPGFLNLHQIEEMQKSGVEFGL